MNETEEAKEIKFDHWAQFGFALLSLTLFSVWNSCRHAIEYENQKHVKMTIKMNDSDQMKSSYVLEMNDAIW